MISNNRTLYRNCQFEYIYNWEDSNLMSIYHKIHQQCIFHKLDRFQERDKYILLLEGSIHQHIQCIDLFVCCIFLHKELKLEHNFHLCCNIHRYITHKFHWRQWLNSRQFALEQESRKSFRLERNLDNIRYNLLWLRLEFYTMGQLVDRFQIGWRRILMNTLCIYCFLF